MSPTASWQRLSNSEKNSRRLHGKYRMPVKTNSDQQKTRTESIESIVWLVRVTEVDKGSLKFSFHVGLKEFANLGLFSPAKLCARCPSAPISCLTKMRSASRLDTILNTRMLPRNIDLLWRPYHLSQLINLIL